MTLAELKSFALSYNVKIELVLHIAAQSMLAFPYKNRLSDKLELSCNTIIIV